MRAAGDTGRIRDSDPDPARRKRRRAGRPRPAGRLRLHGFQHCLHALRAADLGRPKDLACRPRGGRPLGGFARWPGLHVSHSPECALVQRRPAHGRRLRLFVPPHPHPRVRRVLLLHALADKERGGVQRGEGLRFFKGRRRRTRRVQPARDAGKADPLPACPCLAQHLAARASPCHREIRPDGREGHDVDAPGKPGGKWGLHPCGMDAQRARGGRQEPTILERGEHANSIRSSRRRPRSAISGPASFT